MAQRRKKRKPMPESQKLTRRIQGWERTGQPEKAAEGRLVLERVLVREQEQRDANEKRRERYYAKQAEQKALLERVQGAGTEGGEVDGGGALSAAAAGEGGDAGTGTGQPPGEEGRADVLLPDLGGVGEAVGGLGGQVGEGGDDQAGRPVEPRRFDAPRAAALGAEGGDHMAVEAAEATAAVERDREIEELRAQLAAAREQVAAQAPSPVGWPSVTGNVPGNLRRLNITGRNRDAANLRAIKMVVPMCQIPESTREGTEYTTGPCQQAVAHDRSLRTTWFKSCVHGPKSDEFGQPIPEHLRPYYEGGLVEQRTPVLGEGGEVTGWDSKTFYKVNLRITQRVVNPVAASGRAWKIAESQGAKDVTEFGVAPFCQYYDCYRQDLKRYSNGLFCTPHHAKMVKVREDGVVLPLGGFDAAWPGSPSTRKRQEVLAGIDVGRGVAV